jgi:hypothetical protein
VIIIFGEKSYGKVDRVPGVCYVVTVFAHLNFLPLVPVRSFIVLEGTESGGEFRGKQIATNLKSAAAGYARAWLGLGTVVAGAVAAFGLWNVAGVMVPADLGALGVAAVALGGLLTLFLRGKVGGGIQIGVHLGSAALWYLFHSAAGRNPPQWAVAEAEFGLLALFIANMTLLLYGLTRLFDHAGPARRRELLEELGVELPPEDGDEPQQEKWEDWDAAEDRRRR